MARAFHILLVLSINDLLNVVVLQYLIKNKVISGLLVYLVVLLAARIRGVTVKLISTRPVTALKKNTMLKDIRANILGEADLIE